jgi:aldoxime dehydratase
MVNHNKPSRKPHDWVPPVPAFSAKIDGPVTMAYYGVQNRGRSATDLASFQSWISELSSGLHAPAVVEAADYTDEHGHETWVAMLYWRDDESAFARWAQRDDHEAFWQSSERLDGDSGYFREIFHVPNDRLETMYSDDSVSAGSGAGLSAHDGPIQSHNYWGSMRDRIPGSSTDPYTGGFALTAAPLARTAGLGERVIASGIDNLATIRSGELYDGLAGREKDVYETELEPSVREGMRYLRDSPVESGCLSCRHMDETSLDGKRIPRAFAVAHFDSLTRMEDWSESHPTHLRIFSRFIELATELQGNIRLRLWHEVVVTTAQMQHFEYVNCDPLTGMLPYSSELHVLTPAQ